MKAIWPLKIKKTGEFGLYSMDTDIMIQTLDFIDSHYLVSCHT